jgi:hypothetical protein
MRTVGRVLVFGLLSTLLGLFGGLLGAAQASASTPATPPAVPGLLAEAVVAAGPLSADRVQHAQSGSTAQASHAQVGQALAGRIQAADANRAQAADNHRAQAGDTRPAQAADQPRPAQGGATTAPAGPDLKGNQQQNEPLSADTKRKVWAVGIAAVLIGIVFLGRRIRAKRQKKS